MSIDNLEQLIRAREMQMGTPMFDEAEEKKDDSKEVLEIMKLLFNYVKETTSAINQEIITIKQQNQEILDKLTQDKE